MKKRNPLFYEIIIAIVLIALILLPQILGTTMVYDTTSSLDEDGYPTTSTTLEDLQAPGTRFGIIATNDWSYEIKRKYPNGDFLPFNSMSDTYIALENGKIDAALAFIDQIAEITTAHPTIAFIRKPVATLDFGFGLPKTKRGSAICKEMNRYLKKLKESGEFDALLAKWQDKNRQGDVMGDYHFSGEKGTLKVATEGLWTPMTFYVGDQLTGFFIELIKGFCQDAGYRPDFETVSHSASITGTVNASYDLCANPVLMTEERLATVNITDPLMKDDVYLVVNADMQQKEVPRASAFFSSLKESFIRTFITEDRYKILLSGLGVTISLSIIVGLLGTILGAFICYLRMRKNRWVEAGASLYIRLFRGIPVVVLLMVLYYLVFKDVGLTAYWVAIIAFSIDFSAYVSEIFRSGILAVPEGQTSAAKALALIRLTPSVR